MPVKVDFIADPANFAVMFVSISLIDPSVRERWCHFPSEVAFPVFVQRYEFKVPQISVGLRVAVTVSADICRFIAFRKRQKDRFLQRRGHFYPNCLEVLTEDLLKGIAIPVKSCRAE